MREVPNAFESLTKLGDSSSLTDIERNEYEAEIRGELEALKHDIERYVKIAGDLATENEELLEALKLLCPFELVQGDAIRRTNPHSKQMLNSNECWAVSSGRFPAFKIRKSIETINKAIASAEQKKGGA